MKAPKIIVTAGPTCEPIDPVRFISNYSTGFMGYSIAAEAMKKGWQVKEEEVVVVSLENKPGVLSEFADKLKAKNINLAYCYGSACDCSCGSRLVFKAEDNNLAIAALK